MKIIIAIILTLFLANCASHSQVPALHYEAISPETALAILQSDKPVISKKYLAEFDFSNQSVKDADLSFNNLTNTRFSNVNFSNVIFHASNMRQSLFENCKMQNVDFSGVNLTEAQFINCEFENVTFAGAQLMESRFNKTIFNSANFRTSNFKKANLANSSFTQTKIHNTVFDYAELSNVTMNEAFFVGHFPNEPVMPGVLQVEAMGQSGCSTRTLSSWSIPHSQKISEFCLNLYMASPFQLYW